jgi:endonuclease G
VKIPTARWIITALVLIATLHACIPATEPSAGTANEARSAQPDTPQAGPPQRPRDEIHSIHAPLGLPSGAAETSDIIFRHNYTASTNDDTKVVDWVAYAVRAEWAADAGDPGREYGTDPFLDADETLEASPGMGDYDGAYAAHDYDRGHLVPLGSFESAPFPEEVNIYSVMAPQTSRLNRGVWRALENGVRRLAEAADTVYVIAGPWYDTLDPMPLLPGADEPHAVPSGYWMVVYTVGGPGGTDAAGTSGPRVVAFAVPQILPEGARAADYITSVDQLEEMTGLDLLWRLPDEVEAEVEATLGDQWFNAW